MADSSVTFSARVVHGAGRGKSLQAPTVNMDIRDVPDELTHGVYACMVTLADGSRHKGALHYGPRTLFDQGISCEVHLLDTELFSRPEQVTIETIKRIRDVRDFTDVETLKHQIAADIAEIRRILTA